MHGGVVYQKHNGDSDQEEPAIPLPMTKTAMHHFKSLEEYKRHKKEEQDSRKAEKFLEDTDAKSKSHEEKIMEREQRRRLHAEEKIEKERLKQQKKQKNREMARERAFEENFKAPEGLQQF